MPNPASTPVAESQVDRLRVLRYRSRAEMDAAAGAMAAQAISAAVERQGGARIILASAPSQTGFLQQLLTHGVPWEKVTVFHMDEYVGLDRDASRELPPLPERPRVEPGTARRLPRHLRRERGSHR
jgi:glucosamine-6-phosphate deaminase